MNKRKIIYFILAMIPVLAVLLLLAMVNVLYMLLGTIVVLACLLALKRFRPAWFVWKNQPEPPVREPVPQEPPPQKPKTYMILAAQGTRAERNITVNKPIYYIGRGETNDFELNDPRVGRKHLCIEYRTGENVCYATDQGSVNGTYLNSVRMTAGKPYRLVQGDRIMINDYPFEVEYAHY